MIFAPRLRDLRVIKGQMEQEQNDEQPEKPREIKIKLARRKDMFTTSQLGEELNVTRRTVYNWIASGQIPAVKVGVKLWGIRAHVVQALKDGRDPWRAENGYKSAIVRRDKRDQLAQQKQPDGQPVVSSAAASITTSTKKKKRRK